MKKIFEAYAGYNKNTNRIIFETVSSIDSELLIKKFDTYYSSMGQILFHLIESDTRWVNRMSPFCDPHISTEHVSGLKEEIEKDTSIIIEKWDDIAASREKADDNIIDIIDAVSNEALYNDFEMQFGSKKIKLILWKLLFQWFNHHTHHRGQVSVILDMLGIDNDYSLVLDKINEEDEKEEQS